MNSKGLGQKPEAIMRSPVEMRLMQDLRFSKSSYMPWGKQVIRAIDMDDCLTLIHVYETMASLGADVNARVYDNAFGGYVWTAYIHNFAGETALHMCLRQKKLKCAYMLLALGADANIENLKTPPQTAADLMHVMYRKTVREMQLDAFRVVIPLLPIDRLQELPKRSTLTHVNWKTIEKEAWDLMREGRSYHVDLPESLQVSALAFEMC
jgi:hypothetical protein